MSNPPSLYWSQADSQGISIDDRVNAWHAGVVKDVLVTSSGSVIAATDSGSLWAVTDAGTGVCLFDTDKPDFWCLAQGVDGSDHVYAGGVGLFETDVSQAAPLLAWADISFNDGSGNPVGTVFRIAVMQPGRRIVVATAAGVFWAQIPPGPNQPGCLGAFLGLKATPRGPYTWTAAKGLPPGTFGGLALGPKGRSTDFASIAVSAWGPNPKSGLFGLFFGDWDDSGQLKFVRAETPGVDQTLMAYSSIASCKGFPATMYASCSDVNGNLLSVLSSIDGGQKWYRLDGALIKTPDVPKTIYDFCTGQGNDSGRPNNALGAGPITPSRVALGWRAGPLLSDDGGRTFALIQDKYDPTGGDRSKYEHLHADIHAVLFDPTDAAGQRLFVASDGGHGDQHRLRHGRDEFCFSTGWAVGAPATYALVAEGLLLATFPGVLKKAIDWLLHGSNEPANIHRLGWACPQLEIIGTSCYIAHSGQRRCNPTVYPGGSSIVADDLTLAR